MDLSTITVSDFKSLFPKNFPFLPTYDNTAIYNSRDTVYLAATKLFYQCQADGTTGVAPNTDGSKWSKVDDSVQNYVQDSDILSAFAEAQMVFNQALFGTDANIKLAYLYLTAHYLVNDLRTQLAGIGGTALYPVNSRSAGSVSESYTIPQAYLDDPILAAYAATMYGMKYLSFVLPLIRGNVGFVFGTTVP